MTNRATEAQLLEQRITENKAAQDVDLATWIFERLPVATSDSVLELCCGTGGQTLHLLEGVGERGRVYALDESGEALNTLTQRARARGDRLVTLQANLDDVSGALRQAGLHPRAFDLAFCAYGLYYSSHPTRTLEETVSWLKVGGRLAIVGPFGPNNAPLFDLLRESGLVIPEPVMLSSDRFMKDVVIPWAALKFSSMKVHTLVNRVRWETAERVVNYWQNTTFFSEQHKPEFERRLRQHFAKHGNFVNEKWVMMVEMLDARS